jgi:biopolymer transport protein TolQ
LPTIAFIPLANMLFALKQSNAPGQLIVVGLLIWSVWVWTVMVTKLRDLGRARRTSAEFISLFRRERDPVALYLKRRRFDASPLFKVYENGCLAIGGELDDIAGVDTDELLLGGMGDSLRELSARQCEMVRNSVERTVTDQAMMLEDRMGTVANAVSTCPFLGLLGTVWGVMDAFGGMAVSGAATLSAVAPGISGALLTTIVGLLVAIPSAIGYNVLTNRIRKLHVQMDNFAQEFMSAVQRAYLSE